MKKSKATERQSEDKLIVELFENKEGNNYNFENNRFEACIIREQLI